MLQRTTRLGLLACLATLLLAGTAACGDGETNVGAGGDAGGSGATGGTGGDGGSGGSGGLGGAEGPAPRLRFIDTYPAISVSADGTVAAISDQFSGTTDVYFFDVASGALEKKTATGSAERYVNGFSADGAWIIGSRGTTEVPSVWSEATDWIDLDSPFELDCDGLGSGWDLNENGSVAVGMLWTEGCGSIAARWSRTDDGYTLTELERLGDINRATVISADGSLAGGFTHTDQGNRTPAIWRADGTGVLIAPEGQLGTFGEVLAVSDDGTMVAGNIGESGFYWTEETGLVEIGTLPDPLGNPLTLANAIAADNRLIFGGSGHRVFSTQHAFVWTEAAGIRSLQEIVEANGLEVREDYVLSLVMGASSDGTVVVGFASNPETQDWISFVLELPVSAYGL